MLFLDVDAPPTGKLGLFNIETKKNEDEDEDEEGRKKNKNKNLSLHEFGFERCSLNSRGSFNCS